jgi:hypothetical protein
MDLCVEDTMRFRWIVMAAALGLVGPSLTTAQNKDEADDFVHDVLGALFGPNWSLFVHGGFGNSGRFLLQRPAGSNGGERALRGADAFSLGGGAGVDVLPRIGFRLDYTYTSNDLIFRTDNGDGSEDLDLSAIGTLQSHVATAEVVRYMLSNSVAVTPYASVGLAASWWVLDQGSAALAPAGGNSQFRMGALASVGMQAKVSEHFGVRLEAATASLRNPFTGRDSFRADGGTTVDEPTRVRQSDFRFIAFYKFGKSDRNKTSANR